MTQTTKISNTFNTIGHVWVLRYSNNNNFFAHFIDLENKIAFIANKEVFVDEVLEVDINIWENKYIQIGTLTYDFSFSNDMNTLFIEALGRKYIYTKYVIENKIENLGIKKLDKYWIDESNDLIYNFSEKHPSKAILYKRQLNIDSNEGQLSGNWSLYQYKNISLLRFQIGENNNLFLKIKYFNSDSLYGYLWDVKNETEKEFSLRLFN